MEQTRCSRGKVHRTFLRRDIQDAAYVERCRPTGCAEEEKKIKKRRKRLASPARMYFVLLERLVSGFSLKGWYLAGRMRSGRSFSAAPAKRFVQVRVIAVVYSELYALRIRHMP